MSGVIGAIGIILIIIGLYVLLSTAGVQLPELSFVATPGATVGDISEEKAVNLFVGVVILSAGIGMAYKGFSGGHKSHKK